MNLKPMFSLVLLLVTLASMPVHAQTPTQQVQEIYIAYYGRPADPAGLNFWEQQLGNNGGDLTAIIDQFGSSPEYTDRFAGLGNETLINNLYRNLFGRDADSAGLAFYLERLLSGVMTLGTIALNIADGVTDGSSDAGIINNKISVATAYTMAVSANNLEYGSTQVPAAVNLIAGVTGTQTSVNIALSSIDALVATSNSEAWVSEFDAKMQAELASNQIPGMAVALVKGSETVLAKGYGLRDVANNLPVDANTLFHIASTHKSMNAMLIAKLVDNNVVAWDTPVVNYYPEFQLGSVAATNSVNLVHLLSMSSGIPASAEDLLDNDATTDDVFQVASEAALLGAPGTQYSYSNISASIAGYIGVIASTGSDQNLFENYSTLLQTNILQPIGMLRSTISASAAQRDGNLSKTYDLSSSGELVHVPSEDADGDILAPSGSLKSSASEMALYLSTQLSLGVAPNQQRVVSVENMRKTQTPVINGYALGWESVTYRGTQVIMHTGSYDGFVSVLVMIPAQNVGLVLLANSEDAAGDLTESVHEMLVDAL